VISTVAGDLVKAAVAAAAAPGATEPRIKSMSPRLGAAGQWRAAFHIESKRVAGLTKGPNGYMVWSFNVSGSLILALVPLN
jgi:hypothetical protein